MPESSLGALTALHRLRHAETDAARRDLGEALAREAALSAQDDALRRELADAHRIPVDFDREAFAAFLGRMRAERARLADVMREAAARTTSAQTVLARRRAAEIVAGSALASALAARNSAAARREQVALEDIARVLKQTTG